MTKKSRIGFFQQPAKTCPELLMHEVLLRWQPILHILHIYYILSIEKAPLLSNIDIKAYIQVKNCFAAASTRRI